MRFPIPCFIRFVFDLFNTLYYFEIHEIYFTINAITKRNAIISITMAFYYYRESFFVIVRTFLISLCINQNPY